MAASRNSDIMHDTFDLCIICTEVITSSKITPAVPCSLSLAKPLRVSELADY